MKKINLGNGIFSLIDDEDFEKINQYSWHLTKGNYAGTSFKGSTLHMHDLIMNPPKNMVVDHKDGHRLDNRKSNLKNCTQAENTRNRQKFCKKSSEFIGVHWNNSKQKWIVSITYNYNKILLGWFLDEEKAARAYNIGAELINYKFNESYKYNEISKFSNEMILTPYNYKKICDFVDLPYNEDTYGYIHKRKKYNQKKPDF